MSKQSKFNLVLEKHFDKGDHLIAIGERLTQEAWDRIISCVNHAVDEYVEQVNKESTK